MYVYLSIYIYTYCIPDILCASAIVNLHMFLDLDPFWQHIRVNVCAPKYFIT